MMIDWIGSHVLSALIGIILGGVIYYLVPHERVASHRRTVLDTSQRSGDAVGNGRLSIVLFRLTIYALSAAFSIFVLVSLYRIVVQVFRSAFEIELPSGDSIEDGPRRHLG